MVEKIYKKGTAHEKIEHYDVLILGAGPAGLTAAIYTGRYNLSTAVIAKSIGGTANLAGKIENWPGYTGSGKDLMNKFSAQAKKFGAKFLEAGVEKVEKDSDGFVLHLNGKEIHGKTLIIALGTENRKLEIPGEKELVGKGVSYCATCDGMFFKGKNVAVVGGADSAAKAALFLGGICKKVYVIYRREEMRCEPISLVKLKNMKNIEILYHSLPTKVLGKQKVDGLEIVTNPGECPEEKEGCKEKRSLDVDGVFMEIGATAVVDVVAPLGLKVENSYVETNSNGMTNIKGCYAAGDVSNNNLKQVVTAAGEGAIAAKGVWDYLRDLK
jgi:thioredoxin reductase (NADPH)